MGSSSELWLCLGCAAPTHANHQIDQQLMCQPSSAQPSAISCQQHSLKYLFFPAGLFAPPQNRGARL